MLAICFRIIVIYLSMTHFKSGIVKIKDPYMFKLVLEDYKFVNKKVSLFLSISITTTECITAGLLMVGLKDYLSLGIYMGIILHVLFLLVMIINYGRVMPNGCGCFGLHSPTIINFRHIYTNLYLLALFLLCLIYYMQ